MLTFRLEYSMRILYRQKYSFLVAKIKTAESRKKDTYRHFLRPHDDTNYWFFSVAQLWHEFKFERIACPSKTSPPRSELHPSPHIHIWIKTIHIWIGQQRNVLYMWASMKFLPPPQWLYWSYSDVKSNEMCQVLLHLLRTSARHTQETGNGPSFFPGAVIIGRVYGCFEKHYFGPDEVFR